MHFHAARNAYDWHEASTFPLGYMNQTRLAEATAIALEPGDILGLISDGIYEYENSAGVRFGQDGIVKVLAEDPEASAEELVQRIMQAARKHGGPVPQADDITIVLVRRLRDRVP
jgi:serine phosphatase RsbU (regulator of sigma subunit)